jgi:hypothetical protein
MLLNRKIKSFLPKISAFIFLFSIFSSNIFLFAQGLPNAIKLYVPFVTVGDKRIPTRNDGSNSWTYDGELTDRDFIRFGWDSVAIDLSYKQFPTPGGGWIAVYSGNEVKPENLIAEHGTSPIPVSKLAPKLAAGQNRILIVFVDNTNNPVLSKSKVAFSFKYKSATPDPVLNVNEPSEGALFLPRSEKNFRFELINMALENSEDNDLPKGQIKVFLNDINTRPLTIIRNSKKLEDGKHLVEFTNKAFDSSIPVPDSKDSKFIFQLAKPDGQNIGIPVVRSVVTNFEGSLKDIGLPEIGFVEPRSDRLDMTVDPDRKFILDIKNFNILPELQVGANEDGKGYLQIFIDDNPPIKTIWPKNSFTLREIGFNEQIESKKTIKVQLVNKDFTRLSPEKFATLEIVYKPDIIKEDSQNVASQIESTNWRLLVVLAIVSVIIIGIMVLIIKG